ncbi:MAG: sigma-70 family RNA polymerase sigma factor [Planctomycetes bacterium]|nr:sigma-70 family RNA polymerase sigma factor [Planctomycetota bacterium]
MKDDWSQKDDAALLAAVKEGELGAFTALVGRHQRSLINFFYHLCWDRQASEDGAQEVFLRIYSHLDSYEPQAKFTTFLFRIARNLWIDRMRTAAVHGKPLSLQSEGGGAGEGRALQDRVASKAASPVDILARREQQDALRRAIDQLPDEQKAVVILSEIQGMKYQDIGEILGVPVGTVKSRMHTAMDKLKDLLSVAELS